ncbi:CHASE2 domain-containing protein [Deinococcus taeanensis]|uniref:CHASE2 domain-containing protein n=1 Tax=Deinococcus taeanensis TaxID=2737050 RepID=UPI001CDC4DAE|nr:CHASE2 domain-containing protein [Deinococcus taeanensis]UBV42924.1 CHASE2 domain-containing protein [Deinococcus taeanensis]
MLRSAEWSLTRYAAPAAALLGALLALTLPDNPRLWDALSRALMAPTDRRVVVVGIDDASLRDYGPIGGWPRELYGQALGTLEQAGAAAIGLDVLLTGSAQSDRRLTEVLSRPNVVVATAPGEARQLARPAWHSRTGVSALNISPGGVVRSFQTGYAAPDGQLEPSFARQLAAAAGWPVEVTAAPRVLRLTRPDPGRLPALSFRDVVSGTVRGGALQGRVVLIGVTAAGSGRAVRDVTGQVVSRTEVQARAVSSLLGAPFTPMPLWLTVLLSALLAAAAARTRGLWGFALACGTLAVSAPLWLMNILLPGVTLSFAALIGTALVALDTWWTLRTLSLRDPLTGVGNRVALTRALEQRWASRQVRPLGLLLVDLSGFRRVNERYGAAAGDALLRELSGRLAQHRRRGDRVFRWGADEFAVLLDQPSAQELTQVTRSVQDALEQFSYRSLTLKVNVGAARTGEDIQTPVALVEAASRSRHRVKYQREQRG